MDYTTIITAYTALATTHQMLSNASLENILKLYGLLCIFSLPIGLVILISLYRKHPDTIKEMNDKIDRLVDGKDNKEEKKNSDIESDKYPERIRKDNISRKPKEEENMELGIANLVFSVGDKYQCFLSKVNRQNIRGGIYTWSTDNSFVGRIHEYKGVFEAKKVGTTYIEYGAEHIRIYFARIEPSDKTWFGYRPIMDILRRDNIDNVKCREIKKRIIKWDDEKNLLSYKTPEGILAYEFDRTNCVKRVLLKFSDNGGATEGIINNMKEYFERITIAGLPSDHCYWYHKCGYDDECGYPESVDFVAFLRPSKDGKMYFGIGENWRTGASVSEISENLEMVDRSFLKLLDKADVPTRLGLSLKQEENENDKKATERATTNDTDRNRNEAVTAEETRTNSAIPENIKEERKTDADGTAAEKEATSGDAEKQFPDISDLPDTENNTDKDSGIYGEEGNFDEEGGFDESLMDGSGFDNYETEEPKINANE